jgi:predicted nucleic acid-binding protein
MLALTLRHKVPDCMYLALAERHGAGLCTADRRLAALAEGRGVATFLLPSA